MMNILDNFISVYEGNIDLDFWRGIFSLEDESGVELELLTGWLGKFFPYAPHKTLHFSGNLRAPE